MPGRTSQHAWDERGFTLIELLVVILIIGVLAAIAIPSFINQRAKGQDAVAKADARTAQTAMETCFQENQTYDGCDTAKLKQIEPSLGAANNFEAPVSGWGYRPLTSTSYSVAVYTKGSAGTRYVILREYPDGTGVPRKVERYCLPAGQGGCGTDYHW